MEDVKARPAAPSQRPGRADVGLVGFFGGGVLRGPFRVGSSGSATGVAASAGAGAGEGAAAGAAITTALSLPLAFGFRLGLGLGPGNIVSSW